MPETEMLGNVIPLSAGACLLHTTSLYHGQWLPLGDPYCLLLLQILCLRGLSLDLSDLSLLLFRSPQGIVHY